MKALIKYITYPFVREKTFNSFLLFFRVAISIELIVAHGLKKIGIGGMDSEVVPNPLHLPEVFNQSFAIAANLFFPLFVIIGCFTRLAAIPILCVTLTGYFVVHWNDAALVKDTPFIYSLSYLMILVFGPGKFSVDGLISKKIM